MRRVAASLPASVFLTATLLPGPASAASIGERLASMLGEVFGPIVILLTAGSILIGLFLFGKGLAKLVEAANSGGRTTPVTGFMMLAIAACLIALPDAAGIGMSSMAGSKNFFGSANLSEIEASIDDPGLGSSMGGSIASGVSSHLTSLAKFSPPESCLSKKDAVPCMAGNLAVNVVPVAILGAFAFAFLCGLWVFASQMMALAKSTSEAQGIPPGWWSKILGAILLMNGPVLLSMVTSTLFGTQADPTVDRLSGTLNAGSTILSYSTGTTSGALAKYETLVGHCLVILALFGVVAFIRGIMTVMAAGDGKGQATIGHGVTYILAGAIMINSKSFTCFTLTTLGVQSAAGLGFC